MALCIALTESGTVVATGEPVTACTGYVLVSGSEFSTQTVVERLFQWPDADIAAGWLLGSFGFVFGTYLLARLAGSVLSMFDHQR